MRAALAVALALALSVGAGCKRKPVPSPEYAEAEGLYGELVSARGEGAWLDPEMDRVYTLCNSVSEKSSDYAASRTMMAKIDSERAKLKNLKSNFAPQAAANNAPPEFLPDRKTDTPAAAADTDAGPADVPGFEVGNDFSKTLARYGPCFTPTSVQVKTDQGMADGYTWAGRADCPKALAVTADKVILVKDGKIAMVIDKSRMIARTFETDEDGGTRQVAGPPPEAAASDAGTR